MKKRLRKKLEKKLAREFSYTTNSNLSTVKPPSFASFSSIKFSFDLKHYDYLSRMYPYQCVKIDSQAYLVSSFLED